MKLLYCTQCGDIFNIKMTEKVCSCGQTKGAYDGDGLHAWYSGKQAVPLGLTNTSFKWALHLRPQDGAGSHFTAFVIPYTCPTFKHLA